MPLTGAILAGFLRAPGEPAAARCGPHYPQGSPGAWAIEVRDERADRGPAARIGELLRALMGTWLPEIGSSIRRVHIPIPAWRSIDSRDQTGRLIKLNESMKCGAPCRLSTWNRTDSRTLPGRLHDDAQRGCTTITGVAGPFRMGSSILSSTSQPSSSNASANAWAPANARSRQPPCQGRCHWPSNPHKYPASMTIARMSSPSAQAANLTGDRQSVHGNRSSMHNMFDRRRLGVHL